MNIPLPDGWVNHPNSQHLVAELQREINEKHILYGVRVKAIAKNDNSDDVIFEIMDNTNHKFAIVHLTFSEQKDSNSDFPLTEVFEDMEGLKARLNSY